MSRAYSLSLPMPPSVNHYYGTTRQGRKFLTERAKLFRAVVQGRCADAKITPLKGRVSFMAWLCAPDKRKRDLDNFCGKALLDALKHGGMYEDDSQIDHLEIRRGPQRAGGGVDVIVCEMGLTVWPKGEPDAS